MTNGVFGFLAFSCFRLFMALRVFLEYLYCFPFGLCTFGIVKCNMFVVLAHSLRSYVSVLPLMYFVGLYIGIFVLVDVCGGTGAKVVSQFPVSAAARRCVHLDMVVLLWFLAIHMMSRGGRLNLPVVIWFVSFFASSDFSSCASLRAMRFQCFCIAFGGSFFVCLSKKKFIIAATRVAAIG